MINYYLLFHFLFHVSLWTKFLMLPIFYLELYVFFSVSTKLLGIELRALINIAIWNQRKRSSNANRDRREVQIKFNHQLTSINCFDINIWQLKNSFWATKQENIEPTNKCTKTKYYSIKLYLSRGMNKTKLMVSSAFNAFLRINLVSFGDPTQPFRLTWLISFGNLYY